MINRTLLLKTKIGTITKTLFLFFILLTLCILAPMSALFYTFGVYQLINLGDCGINVVHLGFEYNFNEILTYIYDITRIRDIIQENPNNIGAVSNCLHTQAGTEVNYSVYFNRKTKNILNSSALDTNARLGFRKINTNVLSTSKLFYGKHSVLPWEQIASELSYPTKSSQIFKTNTNILNEELDNYEWFTLLKAEIDMTSKVPLDLAVKYGRDYMGGLVNHRVNTTRQLYYRGLTQDIAFRVPLSGTLGNEDTKLALKISPTFKMIDWDNLTSKKDKFEKYSEFIITSIDSDSKSFSEVDLQTMTDSFGLYSKLKYSIDNNGRYSADIDKNPASLQEFLTWRDHSTDFDKETWADAWRLGNGISKNEIIPDTYLSKNKNNGRDAELNPFKSLLHGETQKLLGKNSFLGQEIDASFRIENIKYIKGSGYHMGGTRLYKHGGLFVDESADINQLLGNLRSEIGLFSDYVHSLVTEESNNSQLEFKKQNVKSLSIFGNTYLDFFVMALRNPLLDFSYINTPGIHYDTLDSFWDKRPSTTKWLWSDMDTINPIGGFELKGNQGSLISKFFKKINKNLNYSTMGGSVGIGKLTSGSVISESINNTLGVILSNEIKPTLPQNLEFTNGGTVIMSEIITESCNSGIKINITQDLLKNTNFSKDIITDLMEKNSMSIRTLNVIKNLNINTPWALRTFGDFIYTDKEKISKKINRLNLKKILLEDVMSGNLCKEASVRLLHGFDVIFGENGIMDLTYYDDDIMYMLGLVELGEKTSGLYLINLETMLILAVQQTKNNVNLEDLHGILQSEQIWEAIHEKIKKGNKPLVYQKPELIYKNKINADVQNSVENAENSEILNINKNKVDHAKSQIEKDNLEVLKIIDEVGYVIQENTKIVDGLMLEVNSELTNLYKKNFYTQEIYTRLLAQQLNNVNNITNIKQNEIRQTPINSYNFKLIANKLNKLNRNNGDKFRMFRPKLELIKKSVYGNETYINKLNSANLKRIVVCGDSLRIATALINLNLLKLKEFLQDLTINDISSNILNTMSYFYVIILKIFYTIGLIGYGINPSNIAYLGYDYIIGYIFKVSSWDLNSGLLVAKTNITLYKNTINKFLLDTEKSYYRVELPLSDYLFLDKKKKLATMLEVHGI